MSEGNGNGNGNGDHPPGYVGEGPPASGPSDREVLLAYDGAMRRLASIETMLDEGLKEQIRQRQDDKRVRDGVARLEVAVDGLQQEVSTMAGVVASADANAQIARHNSEKVRIDMDLLVSDREKMIDDILAAKKAGAERKTAIERHDRWRKEHEADNAAEFARINSELGHSGKHIAITQEKLDEMAESRRKRAESEHRALKAEVRDKEKMDRETRLKWILGLGIPFAIGVGGVVWQLLRLYVFKF